MTSETCYEFETCYECAYALVNCDNSMLEYNHSAEEMEQIVSNIESVGIVTMSTKERSTRPFECYICGETSIGFKAIFE